ncbi:MAG: sensor histidine kinase [Candidatus Binatia bacterium]
MEGLVIGPEELVAASYARDRDALLSSRLRTGALCFLVVGTAVSLLELVYFPNRLPALLAVSVLYVVICAGAIAVAALRPQRIFAVAVVGVLVLTLSVVGYHTAVQNRAEMLAIALTLFLTGTAVLLPWGARGQALGSAGPLVGYGLALAAGAPAASPMPYGLAGLGAAAVLTTLSAYLLEQHRWTSHQREAQLRRAEQFSAALLEVAQALNATLSDPQGLATALVEQTRRALRGDWAILYTPQDDASFRVAAVVGVAAPIADELRTLGFNPDTMGPFYRQLIDQRAIEVSDRDLQQRIAPQLLERWQTASFCSRAIEREGQVIGILGCCWHTRRGPLAREAQWLGAIASQAAAALENARLIEDARAANQVKSEFVATISHELRTPLNVIIGYVSLLREGAFEPPEQVEALERVHHQSLQLLELIQAMLNIHRIEAGELPLHLEHFAVATLLDALRHNLPASWLRPGVALRWDAGNGIAPLHSDRGKIEMILRNLVHNALKYTDAGAVSVRAAAVGEAAVRFTVADSGAGISPADLSTIFEMFRQGADSPPRDGGVGLGLYIVKRLTEALGGAVEVRSTLGQGSEFTVTVPRAMP